MSARAHWETHISRRRASEAPPRILPAPSTLTAEAGSGHVSLTWSRVEGAAGYLIHHAPAPDGPWTPLDHHSRDVLAHPGPRYADTTGEPGVERFYAVASVAGAETEAGPLSEVVSATPGTRPGRCARTSTSTATAAACSASGR